MYISACYLTIKIMSKGQHNRLEQDVKCNNKHSKIYNAYQKRFVRWLLKNKKIKINSMHKGYVRISVLLSFCICEQYIRS